MPTSCFVVDVLGTASINLPMDTVLPTALPGCVLQLLPMEIDVTGGLADITATNALGLTIGAF